MCPPSDQYPMKDGLNPYWRRDNVPSRPSVRYRYVGFSLMDFVAANYFFVLIFFVLPLSFVWGRLNSFYAFLASRRVGKVAAFNHERKVKRVQACVRSRDPKRHGLIRTSRPAFWATTARKQEYKSGQRFEVDVSDLRDVVNIDLERRRVYVEPGANMAVLSAALIPHGLCVPVVPEYEDLTVGGLINGYGIEGSSHKYGLFSDTVLSMDIILADGTLAHCTRDNDYADLFHAIPWSYGALGLLVGCELSLVPVKPYMRLSYIPIRGTLQQMADAYHQLLVPKDRSWAEYVEGLIFSSTEGVVTIADYADEQEARRVGPINRMGRWYKPWFHRYAKAILERQAGLDGAPYTEYVPTKDYLLRHTRSLYWMADLFVPMGNHPVFRWLLGWLMPPRVFAVKLSMTRALLHHYDTKFVAQDVLVPAAKTGPCMEFVHDNFDIYPLWLCGHRLFKTRRGTMLDCEKDYDAGPELAQGDSTEAQMYVDVGLWYCPAAVLRGEEYDVASALRKLEAWLIANHGYQALYAVTELTEDDFWRMFDKKLYAEMRRRYGAENVFFDVYQKIGKPRRQKVT